MRKKTKKKPGRVTTSTTRRVTISTKQRHSLGKPYTTIRNQKPEEKKTSYFWLILTSPLIAKLLELAFNYFTKQG